MIQLVESAAPATVDDGIQRRDFLNVAALSFAGVGVVAATFPLITQLNPSADQLAVALTELDLSKIAPGQAIKNRLAQAAGVRAQFNVKGDRRGQCSAAF